jgi:hypothetical protein
VLQGAGPSRFCDIALAQSDAARRRREDDMTGTEAIARSPRYALQLPLGFSTPSARGRAATRNISASGVLFAAKARCLPLLRPGQSLTVTVMLNDPATEQPLHFEAQGKVVRVEADADAGHLLVAATLNGLQFLANAPRGR